MKLVNFFTGIIFTALVLPALTLAASSDFTIRTFVGSDTTPPTTPTLLAVVPVATTQINVNWTAATDDVAVAGYLVFRGGVQIATTTLLTYSDTGLTASTTYSYFIDAFDTFGNISSSSATVATTTLPIVVTPPSATTTAVSGAQTGTLIKTMAKSLIVETTQRAAILTWETKRSTQYTLQWGRTTSFELGSVSGSIFKQAHQTTIDNLEPGTTYYYKLEAVNEGGLRTLIASDRFTTKSPILDPDFIPNVQQFTARAEDSDVRLTWSNNFTNPNYVVRVVRSHLFYPSTIQSGAVVYEGRAQSFLDSQALALRSPQYYTIFVLDGTGAVSSGAVARAYRTSAAPGEGTDSGPETIPVAPIDVGNDTVVRASSISLIQGESMSPFDAGLILDMNEQYLISIPYSAVPKNLKSIIVTVQNPSNQRLVSAYLLKLNPTGDAYVAVVAKAGIVGQARITVEVFDYEQATVRRISTTVTFVDLTTPVPFFPDRLLQSGPYVLLALITLGSGCGFWWLLLKRRKKGINSRA